jgi:hypothetical protein
MIWTPIYNVRYNAFVIAVSYTRLNDWATVQ